ncbi:MAG TPA: helix-turn-helix domain-containing protein [Burkholderiaceae bacterium]
METLDTQQAAQFLHMHPVTLQGKARRGEIPGAKLGKQWVFLRLDLMAYIRAQYVARVSQGDTQENIGCHFTNAKTHLIGGSKSRLMGKTYQEVLGLPTKHKLRNTTTD